MAKKNPSAKGPRKKSRFDRIVFWGIIVSAIAIAVLLWGPFNKYRKARQAAAPVKKQELASREPRDRRSRPDRTPELRQPEITAVVAIIIDDLGQDLKPAEDVLALQEEITLAVMPRLPQSKKIAELAGRRGREIIIHMPMEAKGRGDKRPAPGILRADMTPMELISAVNDNLDSVPGAVGINNHEGSALTENREAMTFLMSELKNRNFFFLDSMTSPKSMAWTVAKEFGLKAAKRDVFLDNENDKPLAINKQLAELGRVAKQHGQAIGIGHPHPATIEELRKWLPEAAQQGIEVVPVSRLMQ
jgi:polysaccharide deacetylase 2 family uncharacterized protein YibQ